MYPSERAQFFSERRSEEARVSRTWRLHAGAGTSPPSTASGTAVFEDDNEPSSVLDIGMRILEELETAGAASGAQQGVLW